MSLLTKHGLFKEAPTSEEADINMEPDEELSENELLSEDNENQYSNERSERDKEASDTQGERIWSERPARSHYNTEQELA